MGEDVGTGRVAIEELPCRRVVVAGPQILEPSTPGVDDSPRRRLHGPENALGESDDELGVLRSVIDGLVAKRRLRALAGGNQLKRGLIIAVRRYEPLKSVPY